MTTIRSTLGKLSSLITSGSRGWAEYYADAGALFLRMTNLPKEGIKLLLHDNKYVALPSSSSEGQRTSVKQNDILISITAELGKIGFVEVDPGEAYVNQHVALVRISSSKAYPKFVAYYLAGAHQRQRWQRLNDPGAKAALNLQTINKYQITLPPLEHQIAVASLLSTWDTAIEKMERLIEVKEKRFSWLLNRLINQGSVQGEWRRVKLGELLTESRVPDEENNPKKRISVRLHLKGVEAREYRGTEAETATIFFRRKAGQFVYGKQNIFRGAVGIIPVELDGYSSTQDIPAFDISFFVWYDWLLFYFSRLDFYKRLETYASGSGSKRLHPEELFNIQVKLPSLEQQKKIAETLNTARQEIDLLKKQAEAYRKQKRGLMQKLLTGQWRVGVDNNVE